VTARVVQDYCPEIALWMDHPSACGEHARRTRSRPDAERPQVSDTTATNPALEPLFANADVEEGVELESAGEVTLQGFHCPVAAFNVGVREVALEPSQMTAVRPRQLSAPDFACAIARRPAGGASARKSLAATSSRRSNARPRAGSPVRPPAGGTLPGRCRSLSARRRRRTGRGCDRARPTARR
jgi:hypothetical protein